MRYAFCEYEAAANFLNVGLSFEPATDLRVVSEAGGDVYCPQCQRWIARPRCRISERNVRECQK
jgi:hypothetical protein